MVAAFDGICGETAPKKYDADTYRRSLMIRECPMLNVLLNMLHTCSGRVHRHTWFTHMSRRCSERWLLFGACVGKDKGDSPCRALYQLQTCVMDTHVDQGVPIRFSGHRFADGQNSATGGVLAKHVRLIDRPTPWAKKTHMGASTSCACHCENIVFNHLYGHVALHERREREQIPYR